MGVEFVQSCRASLLTGGAFTGAAVTDCSRHMGCIAAQHGGVPRPRLGPATACQSVVRLAGAVVVAVVVLVLVLVVAVAVFAAMRLLRVRLSLLLRAVSVSRCRRSAKRYCSNSHLPAWLCAL